MKSILLKTLAATLLVATAQAQVNVLSVSWRERHAKSGQLFPWSVSTPRAYMIFDSSLLTATPAPGTLIYYTTSRNSSPAKVYTIDRTFRAFTADSVADDSGRQRIYGRLLAPVQVEDVTNPLMPFSGTASISGFPMHVKLDPTHFNGGTSLASAGPQIIKPGVLDRSQITGAASVMPVTASTLAGAEAELTARLNSQGFVRGAVAPDIVTNLPPTLALADGQVQPLSVVLGPNVFPTPTYQWFKNDVAITAANGGTAPVLNVTGAAAATGSGTYRVEVSTAAGSVVSTNTVVTPLAYTFATNLPATATIFGANTRSLSVVLSPAPITEPTYQWFKNNVAINAAIGGTASTLTVIGGEAATGAGTYRVEVTSSAGPLVSGNCVVTVSPVATNFAFTTNLPRTTTAPFASTTTLNPVVNTAAGTPAVASRQWFRAPLATPTAFVPIATGDGGNGATLAVSGNNASVNGPGVYYVVVTSVGASPTVITSVSCTVTSAP